VDGLRLALIIVGVAVVAAVYLLSARRRRMEREAGDFQRFEAWSDERLDPLADDPPDARAHAEAPVGEAHPVHAPEAVEAAQSPEAPDDADASSVTPPENLPGPEVLQGLEAIAESLDTRAEPSLGAIDEVLSSARARPRPATAPRKKSSRNSAREGRAGSADPQAGAEPPAPVVLNVLAPEGEHFQGPDLKTALEDAGLRPGDMQLYHYRAEAQPATAPPIFSALNVVRPGTLSPEELADLATPGIALVMQLPGIERPSEAFELMHGAAARIAEALGGRLCDETRSTLTRQALNHIREHIAEHVRRRHVGA
jgi:cell division protein ZipA